MLSFHLAEFYNVETRALIQSVKRNIKRFPPDFMFQLNKTEANLLVSQNVIPHRNTLEDIYLMLLQNKEWLCCPVFSTVTGQYK